MCAELDYMLAQHISVTATQKTSTTALTSFTALQGHSSCPTADWKVNS